MTSQQVGTVTSQGGPEFRPIPDPAQRCRVGFRHRDRHKRTRLGKVPLQAAETLQDLVAVLEATALDPFPELLQATRQATALATADGTLLVAPWPTAGQ